MLGELAREFALSGIDRKMPAYGMPIAIRTGRRCFFDNVDPWAVAVRRQVLEVFQADAGATTMHAASQDRRGFASGNGTPSTATEQNLSYEASAVRPRRAQWGKGNGGNADEGRPGRDYYQLSQHRMATKQPQLNSRQSIANLNGLLRTGPRSRTTRGVNHSDPCQKTVSSRYNADQEIEVL